MAMRLERAHAEVVGEHEGVLVGGSCGLAPRRIAPHHNGAEEPQSLCLAAMVLVLAGLCQRGAGERGGARRPTPCSPTPRFRLVSPPAHRES